MTDEDIIDAILLREGGYVDHPADRGGPTNHGITLATLASYRGDATTVDDLKALTESQARTIYREQYIIEPGFHLVTDDRLRSLLVDSGVNHGTEKAVEMLQRAIGVRADGILGPLTLTEAMQDPGRSYLRMCAERVRAYGRIISNNHSQAVFAAGWAERIAGFIEAAT